jgi:DNA-binding MarR family transcriptional regulator
MRPSGLVSWEIDIKALISCQDLDNLNRMPVPPLGERYRGVEGHSGYLLRQAWHVFRAAMDDALRPNGLNGVQYGVLSVLARDPGSSGADLARACNTSAQAMNGVLSTLGRAGLVERHPHPTHGRIVQVELTPEGRQRLEAATPAVRKLEATIDEDFDAATIKAWLVAAAQRLERLRESGLSSGSSSTRR